ncbi:chromo domain-like protein [Mycena leptocephala]|nr:chromo domain-like protein [Mycena leptocephala]
MFTPGEIVLCHDGPLIYVARILQTTDDTHFVHYKGWNAKWDEWVPESRLLKDTVDNRTKQKDALAIVAASHAHPKASTSKVNRDRTQRDRYIRADFAPLGSPTKRPTLSTVPSFASPTRARRRLWFEP